MARWRFAGLEKERLRALGWRAMVLGSDRVGATANARERGLTIRVGVTLGQERLGVEQLWPAVESAEQLGYDSVWLSDTATREGLAPLVTLAAIAGRTERLKLGTSVLVLPPRNPVLLARELATVDLVSSGRLLPAGGLGLNEASELAALGVKRSERVARLEETLEVVKLLWPGERVDYDGRFTAFKGLRLDPRPTRRRLEFWLGGRAKAALERVGRLADGWLASFVSPHEFALAREVIRAAAATAHRTIDEDHYGTTVFASLSEDADPQRVPILQLRSDLAVEDHFAAGPSALEALIERFVAEGASKFVVVPVTDDLQTWLEAMRPTIARIETPSV